MSAQKLTPWFPARIDPVRVGRYEVVRVGVNEHYPARTMLQWDGSKWRHTEQSSAGMFPGHRAGMDGKDKWRGLASNPAASSAKGAA